MFLPSGNIYLFKKVGECENVMTCDLDSIEDFKEELNYLFNKCGYEINEYEMAIYKDGDRNIKYKINVSRETLGL